MNALNGKKKGIELVEVPQENLMGMGKKRGTAPLPEQAADCGFRPAEGSPLLSAAAFPAVNGRARVHVGRGLEH